MVNAYSLNPVFNSFPDEIKSLYVDKIKLLEEQLKLLKEEVLRLKNE